MSFAARTPAILWPTLLVLCASLSIITCSRSVFPDPEMLQYLDKLYQDAKKLERPLVNGEMNLLPKKAPSGFANSIRCFSEISASSVSDSSRTLQFNLSSVDSADDIIAIDLVLKQPLTSRIYRTALHEMTREGSEMDLKLLDSGKSEGEWHTLSVQNVEDSVDKVSGVRNYQLLLSLSGGEEVEMREVLQEVKPMLFIYTNDRKLTSTDQVSMTTPTSPTTRRAAPSIRASRGRRLNRSRRQAVLEPEPEPTLAELGKLSCRRQEKTIPFSRLGWPGGSQVVITPGPNINFTFCHGLCTEENSQIRHMYNNHALLMSRTEPALANARVTPCCVQDESTPIEVTYYSTSTYVTVMTTIPHVTSCRCR